MRTKSTLTSLALAAILGSTAAYADRITYDAATDTASGTPELAKAKSDEQRRAAEALEAQAKSAARARAIAADLAAGLDYEKWARTNSRFLGQNQGNSLRLQVYSANTTASINAITRQGVIAEDGDNPNIASAVWFYLQVANDPGAAWLDGLSGQIKDPTADAHYRLGRLIATGEGWPAVAAYIRVRGGWPQTTPFTGDVTDLDGYRLPLAIKWLTIARGKGSVAAERYLPGVLAKATPDQIVTAKQLVRDWQMDYTAPMLCAADRHYCVQGYWKYTPEEEAADRAEYRAAMEAKDAKGDGIGIAILKAVLTSGHLGDGYCYVKPGDYKIAGNTILGNARELQVGERYACHPNVTPAAIQWSPPYNPAEHYSRRDLGGNGGGAGSMGGGATVAR